MGEPVSFAFHLHVYSQDIDSIDEDGSIGLDARHLRTEKWTNEFDLDFLPRSGEFFQVHEDMPFFQINGGIGWFQTARRSYVPRVGINANVDTATLEMDWQPKLEEEGWHLDETTEAECACTGDPDSDFDSDESVPYSGFHYLESAEDEAEDLQWVRDVIAHAQPGVGITPSDVGVVLNIVAELIRASCLVGTLPVTKDERFAFFIGALTTDGDQCDEPEVAKMLEQKFGWGPKTIEFFRAACSVIDKVRVSGAVMSSGFLDVLTWDELA